MAQLNITGPTDTTLAEILAGGNGAASVTTATLQSAAVATGNGTTIDVSGMAALTIQNSVVASGTLTFEASLDDTNWIAINGENVNTGAIASTLSVAAIAAVTFRVAGFKSVRARISTYTSGSITVIARAQANEGPLPQTNVALYGAGSTTAATIASPSDTQSNSTSLFAAAFGELFNGTNWDRQRNNTDLTVLASAARTVLTNSADMTLYNHRTLRIDIDVTAVAGSPSLVFKVQTKDTLSGVYVDVLTAVAITAAGHVQLQVGLGVTPAANLAANVVIGRLWRVVCTPGTADSCTYSVSASAS